MIKDFQFLLKLILQNKFSYKRKIERLIKKPFEPEINILNDLCDQNRSSIDIGVFRGAYSYRLSELSKKVYGFEPNPIMFKTLKKNLCKIKKNIEIFNLALSNQKGSCILKIPIRDDYIYSFRNDGSYSKSKIPFYKKSYLKFNFEDYYEAGLATIDINNNLNLRKYDEFNVLKNKLDNILIRDEIGFIKVDVEGHELECLKGAEKILKTYKPNLLIEINKVHNKNYNQIFKFLKNLHYSCFYYDNKKLIKIFNYDENPREDYKNFIFKKN